MELIFNGYTSMARVWATNLLVLLKSMPDTWTFKEALNKYVMMPEQIMWRDSRGITLHEIRNLLIRISLEEEGMGLNEIQREDLDDWFSEVGRDARSTIDREPQQERQKSVTRRRGRPKKTIKELIENDEGGKRLNALKKAMNGKKGKGAAIVIRAAKKLGWMIEPPTFIAVKEEFGDIGHASGYNKYMSEVGNQITVQEIADAKKALEDMISQ